MEKEQVVKELKELEVKLDEEYGKIRRLFMQGWLSKPAWARAAVWVLLGAVTALAFK